MVYGCAVDDLLDTADYEHTPSADRLVLDKTAQDEVRQLARGASPLLARDSRTQPANRSSAPAQRSVRGQIVPGRLTSDQAARGGRPGAVPEPDALAVLDISDVCDSLTAQPGEAQVMDEPTRLRLREMPGAQLEELAEHLADQWHALVKTDNCWALGML